MLFEAHYLELSPPPRGFFSELLLPERPRTPDIATACSLTTVKCKKLAKSIKDKVFAFTLRCSMLVSFFGDCEFTKSFYDLLAKFQVFFKSEVRDPFNQSSYTSLVNVLTLF